VPSLRVLFGMGVLHADDLALCGGAAGLATLGLELGRRLHRRAS
jgi:hypothetical protein